jgi:hypothetical protein
MTGHLAGRPWQPKMERTSLQGFVQRGSRYRTDPARRVARPPSFASARPREVQSLRVRRRAAAKPTR